MAVPRQELARRRSDTPPGAQGPDARTLEGIVHLGALLTSTLGLGDAAQQIVEYACILTGLPAFMLFVKRDDLSSFGLCAVEAERLDVPDLRLRPIDVAALDVEHRGACAVAVSELRPPELAACLGRQGFPLAWVAPVIVEGVRLKGLLLGLDRRVDRPAEGTLRVLRLLAMQAASALWNAERYEAEQAARAELDRELSRTRALQDAAVAGASSSRMEDVADDLLLSLRQHFGARAGHVRLCAEDGGRLEVISAFGYSGDTLRILRSMQGRVTHPADPVFPGLSLIAIPLQSRGEVQGELCVGFPAGATIDDDELTLLQTVGRIAAQAFENLQVFRAEHRIAETLQQTLLFLPETLEGIEFAHAYRSATRAASVGGDFYDVFDLGDGRVGLVMGDVSGKGVGAASLTLVLRSAVRAYAYDGSTPAQVVAKTSEMMERLSSLSTFATLFFGELDLRTGDLTYCAGGHPPALVRVPGGGVRALPVRSPLLGAMPELAFFDDRAHLAPRDVLLLYTDGILEARGDGGFFGEERLASVFAGSSEPAQAADRIFREVSRFTSGSLTDDVAVLVVRRS